MCKCGDSFFVFLCWLLCFCQCPLHYRKAHINVRGGVRLWQGRCGAYPEWEYGNAVISLFHPLISRSPEISATSKIQQTSCCRKWYRLLSGSKYDLKGEVCLGSICWPPCACATPDNEACRSRTQNLWKVGKNSFPILSRLWTKIHEISRPCRGPSCFPMSLPDYLWLVSFRRHLPLILEVVKNRTNVKVFWSPIFWGTTCTFLQ